MKLALLCVACASSPRPLRVLDGDSTIDPATWTAIERGVRYAVVRDGTPSVPAASDHALAFTVPTDTSGHKQRVEYKILQASDRDGLHFDNARYAGFAFQLDRDPQPFLGSAIFWQAWQGYPWGPPVSLKIAADDHAPYRVRLAIRNAKTGPDSKDPDTEVWSGRVLEPGTWHTFVIFVEPRFDRDGHLALWIDGRQVASWTGPIGYDPARVTGAYAGLDLKDGIYQPGANNGHTFRFDHIVIAEDYDTVAKVVKAP